MTLFQITLLMLLFSTLAVLIAPRTKLPMEVVWVLGSLLISFIPGLPLVNLPADMILTLLLPPILFAAAYFTSWRDFKANRRPIALLSVGLVAFTVTLVAAVTKLFITDMTWPVALMLGAIVAPPDASAAVAVVKKLSVPRRVITLLEGESLVNDATALTAFKFALAASLAHSASVPQIAGGFIWVFAGGILVGLATGWAGLFFLKRLHDSNAEIALSFLVALGSYQIGEHLHVSGVIATVAAGIFFGRCFPEIVNSRTNKDAEASWGTLIFLINSFVFTLLGLQLPSIVSGLDAYTFKELVLLSTVVIATVIGSRILWVFPATYLPRILIPSIRKKDPPPPAAAVTILAWTGIRGIVSLAVALSVPETLANGAPFPHRNLILFLTYAVILATLVLPVLTLPKFIQKMNMKDDGEAAQDRIRARSEVILRIKQELSEMRKNNEFPESVIGPICDHYNALYSLVNANLEPAGFSPWKKSEQTARSLEKRILQISRAKLTELRRKEAIHDEIFHELRREFDNEDMRLKNPLHLGS